MDDRTYSAKFADRQELLAEKAKFREKQRNQVEVEKTESWFKPVFRSACHAMILSTCCQTMQTILLHAGDRHQVDVHHREEETRAADGDSH